MYVYSPKENVFYSAGDKEDCILAGTWPDDAKEVPDETFIIFAQNNPPVGKKRAAGKNGLPQWVEIPPLTDDEIRQQAEAQKIALVSEADNKTRLWQTQLMLGIITEDDKHSLRQWMLYVQEIQATDISNGKNIFWPEQPQ